MVYAQFTGGGGGGGSALNWFARVGRDLINEARKLAVDLSVEPHVALPYDWGHLGTSG